ncbi:MAG: CocE/NonD family hydrolase [Actinobacteria bacterium]|nr:CocE/NonD family hydrolase [Actinomycetota bacterium]
MTRFFRFRANLFLALILAALLVLLPLAPAMGAGTAAGSGGGVAVDAPDHDSSLEITRVDEQWTMEDGVKLPVSVFYPTGDAGDGPGECYPVIVFVHPWDCDKLIFEKMAEEYAGNGYVCVTFTMRGWYGAEGQIGCMDPEKEIRDVRDIITLVSEDERFPVLWDDKGPVVGITGYSMGGCTSFLAAPRKDPRPGDPGDPRIRAVVPMHGGADLEFSILPNGAAKALWGVFLTAGAYIGNISGLMMHALDILMRNDMNAWQKLQATLDAFWKAMPPVNNVTDMLVWITGAAMQRRVEDVEIGRQYLRTRSARYWCDEEYDGVVEHPIIAPTLILAGWNDDIFYANEGLRIFSTAMEAPARMIITNHGHIGGMGDNFFIDLPESPEYLWVSEQIRAWFDRFLKGEDNGADREPKLVFYRDRDPENYGRAYSYPLPGTREASFYLNAQNGNLLLSRAKPRSANGDFELLVNIGVTGSVSLPYYQDVPNMVGGETMQVPSRIKLLGIPLTERSYLSPPLTSDLTIMGAPKLELYYKSSQPFTQLIPWIYEVGPDGTETLVSRGYYEGYNPAVWTMCDTAARPVEMQACYHRFPKGSRIKLEISTADLLMTWPYFGLTFIQLQRNRAAATRLILPVVPNTY